MFKNRLALAKVKYEEWHEMEDKSASDMSLARKNNRELERTEWKLSRTGEYIRFVVYTLELTVGSLRVDV